MTKKRKAVEDAVAAESPTIVMEGMTPTDHLRTSLEEVKNYEGVIGYILRNSTSAAIDLKDPSKLIEYAILSSSALEAAEELSETFSLGEVKNILIEGKETRILSLTVGDNKISVFMEKNADLDKILKRLSQF
ncbi:MAG: roadblock/LC7 domain-containing protein [Candidatus Bathyarchaeia archaeon]|nr:roadblock/LC7 domain-containing protein [Candidatus Bathyarchaeota archaeon]